MSHPFYAQYGTPLNALVATEKILYPGRVRAFFLVVLCTTFSLVGMGAGGGGWLLGLLAGGGALIFASNFLPNAAWLKLDPQGFTYRITYRTHRHNWNDISSFGILTRRYLGFIPVSRSVCFNFTADHKRSKGLGFRMATAIARFDGQLPESYGMKARDLASLLESWRQQAASNTACSVSANSPTAGMHGASHIA